ncbi:hypothetical protein LIER_23265 [Lithospermum erythrorhizon]|uniref:Retrotransposon Copia-like N-terminal domain-containing protein n=1 Tax=Lithospermum erythrorhizon TaxID=34254 RepID=A0AAV3R2F2_LITER
MLENENTENNVASGTCGPAAISPTPPLNLPTKAPLSTNVKNHMNVECTYLNYPNWKRMLIIFLRGQKLLGVVDGTMPCPSPNHVQYDLWTKCNDIALSWLHATLSVPVNETLLNFDCQTAFAAWTILGQLFLDNASATQMHTRQKFQHFKKDELTMDEYLQ